LFDVVDRVRLLQGILTAGSESERPKDHLTTQSPGLRQVGDARERPRGLRTEETAARVFYTNVDVHR